MQKERMIKIENDKVVFRSAGEATSLMICSIAWPMIDTYYAVLVFSLTLIKQRTELDANFTKDVQWMAETLYIQGKMKFYESCNQPSIGNAKSAFLAMNILTRNGPSYITLHKDYLGDDGEKRLTEVMEYLGQFRKVPTNDDVFDNVGTVKDLRKTIFHDYPVMSKL